MDHHGNAAAAQHATGAAQHATAAVQHAATSLNIGLLDQFAVIIALALVGGFLVTKFKLPPIVGFLMAGVLAGPFTPGFVADRHLAEQLGEVGVVLLMFGVGLHFAPKDLAAVKKIAVPGALGQCLATTAIGVGISMAFGWGFGTGLVVGLAISVASTVVLIRALMARNALESNEGRITVGWLIVEDLLSVLILVILPVLASSIGGHAMEEKSLKESVVDALFREGDSVLAFMLRNVGMKETLPTMMVVALVNVALLVAIVFLGKKAAVWLLQQVENTKSEELFTLFVVAMALFIAFGAKAAFGLSVALGAFLAGIMLGDSVLSHRIGTDVRPLRDLFGVIFFTAVGMLFDPRTIVKMPIPLIVILFVIMIGKPLIAGAIVLALKQPLRSVLVIAPALGQIGEFSFILAVVASRMGLLPEQPYQLIITGSILSIALNPVMFWVGDMLAKRMAPAEPEPEAALSPAV